MMLQRALVVSDFAEKEFNRILSNPQNEIISDSIKDRLKPLSKPTLIFLRSENVNYECQLESFSFSDCLSSLEKISISFSINDLSKILLDKNITIACDSIELLNISREQISKVNCFRYEEDTYIMEFSVKEHSNDK
jgi:hypothetical protein